MEPETISRRLDAVRVLLAIALGVVGLGCDAPEPPSDLRMPIVRLLDRRPAALPAGLVWGSYVEMGGEERLVATSLAEWGRPTPGSPTDGAASVWTVPIPPALRDAPWLMVRGTVTAGTRTTAIPTQVVAPAATDGSVRIGFADGKAPGAVLRTQIYPVPAVDGRDLVMGPFVPPAGAALTFGIGVEKAAWRPDTPPVEFRVVAETDGGDVVLDRTVLDPATRASDRAWQDRRVELAAVAGRSIRLRLSTRAGPDARPGMSLPVWADPVVMAPIRAHAMNVIVVSLDTLRAKSMSTYGSVRATTPEIDRLVAAAGTVFEAAYTTAPHTSPAHMSLFTGRWASRHGRTGPYQALPADIRTMPETFRAAGYATAAFTEDGFVLPLTGFRRGFATYREQRSPDLHMPRGQSAATFRAGIDWLTRHRDQPSFLFLHTYEVHLPYVPPPPYDTAFTAPIHPANSPAAELLRYEQEARYLDDEVRALLEALDLLGLGTRTLVVFLSDHGEEFKEHGQLRHGCSLHTESTRIPLLLRLPGIVPSGRRIGTAVSLVDVAPTILELAGLPPLHDVDGQSLVPLLNGGKLGTARAGVLSETIASCMLPVFGSVAISGDVRCIRWLRTGDTRCYDPVVDPDERWPLPAGDARATAVQAAIADHLAARAAAPSSRAADEPAPAVDAAQQEKLRALGYVE